MSCRKSKPSENNENLCPVKGKRVKTIDTGKGSGNKCWKHVKSETASSPSTLTNEYLTEMGIGMLDSEESSSSVTSVIALAVSASTDENSNEATPNLDAPKFCHQRIAYIRSMDNSLDNSIDNANSSLVDPNKPPKESKSSSSDDNCPEAHLQPYRRVSLDTKLAPAQVKSAAATSCGAATSTSTISATSTNINSPTSASKITRSPLATVSCNSYFRKSTNHHQQQNLPVVPSFSSAAVGTQTATTSQIPAGEATALNPSSESQQLLSPSMPSTSQQAALNNQQQQLQKEKQTEQGRLQRHEPKLVPEEHFFLYRQPLHYHSGGKNYFNKVSDEIILQIFKWLPKKTLLRCSNVCQRFNRCVSDESLWTRLDLGGRTLRVGALEHIVTRGVVILRLAQAELNHPVFDSTFLHIENTLETKLQYLDLSMASVTKPSLKMLLSCCRQLKKLSLEHVPINDEICTEIAKNSNLEALNLAMCVGLEAWSVRKLMETLKNLNSLNISWTNLSVDAITSIVTNVTPNLMRLNIAGCRKTMFDSHLASLTKRCPQLLELDLSDCTGLTGNAIAVICKFKMLEYLSLSRCYLIPVSSYMELSNLPTLAYLDVFGMLSDTAMEMLEQNLPNLGINKFIHSSVARPTVGSRRTSIWGLRTRD